MVAGDSSTIIAYLRGDRGDDVRLLHLAIANNTLLLPPVVLSELLSSTNLSDSVEKMFLNFPLLTVGENFWMSTGRMRRTLLKKGLKANLADTMVAQACLENGLGLITRDNDFRHYKKYFGLRLHG